MTRAIKSISLMLTFVMIVTTIFAVPFVTKADIVTTVYINGDNVRVRETPTTSGDNIIEKIEYTSATLIEKQTVSGDIWLKISYVKDGKTKTGYIYYDESYIELREYDPDKIDADFETTLKAFPSSYHSALKALHSEYPEWKFIPDTVSIAFSDAVAAQSVDMHKQVQYGSSSQPTSWRSMGLGSYDWNKKTWITTNGGWTGASREVIAYYMDPRNFLDADSIYMFLDQKYNAQQQNEAGVKKIIKGTFMEKDYTPAKNEPGEGSYVKVIMLAAKESGVSPYIIASKIRQEQGVNGTSSLISGTYTGYKGYYNFFNIGAYSTSTASVTVNGLKTAKDRGWNTRYKSIVGGAKYLANNYINKGQHTYYYQDFNVHGDINHQYAQAVHDAYNKGKSLTSTYKSDKSFALSFSIPVYVNMPKTAAAQPAKNNKQNNYYFDDISVSGLTPSFNKYTYEYSLKVSGDTAIKAVPVSGATNTTKSQIALKKGVNKVKITIKSQTGYTTDYVISVNATKACTLYVNKDGKLPNGNNNSSSSDSSSSDNSSSSGSSGESLPNVTRGDINSDGKISISDLAGVQMHLLQVRVLKGNKLIAADINKDGKISISDLAGVQMHLLGVRTIKQ